MGAQLFVNAMMGFYILFFKNVLRSKILILCILA